MQGVEENKNWLVVDLDGTVCDHAHRVHLFTQGDYEGYHAELGKDKLHKHVMLMIRLWLNADPNNAVLGLTGRPEKHYTRTIAWMTFMEVSDAFDHMLMRPEKNFLPDDQLKLILLDEFFGGRENALKAVFVILDDRDKVVAAFRNAGFKCFQVAQGDY